jgi:DNA-binding response OmpR family regulator
MANVCPHCQGTGFASFAPSPLREVCGVRLSPSEGVLMAELMKAAPKPVSETHLRIQIENYNRREHASDVARVHVWKLRQKLKGKGVEIVNVRGKGYALDKMPGVTG